MAQVTVQVEYRLQYERQPAARLTVEVTVEDDPVDMVLRARARAAFWPDVAGQLTGDVLGCFVDAVRRPGAY